jgi:hypothetical protein
VDVLGYDHSPTAHIAQEVPGSRRFENGVRHARDVRRPRKEECQTQAKIALTAAVSSLLHGFPFIAIGEVRIRKGPLYETSQYDTATRSQRTCGQHVTGHLTCRPIVSEEDDALASYERVEH